MGTLGGQPKIQDWERVRVRAWTDLVQRLTQKEMEKHLSNKMLTDSPFYSCALTVANRWNSPQRKSQFPNTVTMTDLGAIFLGERDGEETRTDFSAYSKGRNARPKLNLLEFVEECLPGTLTYYQIGPYGLPIWQALKGNADQESFWSPLMTARIFDGKEWQRQKDLNRLFDQSSWDKQGLIEISDVDWLTLFSQLNEKATVGKKLLGPAVLFAKILCSLATYPDTEELATKQKLIGVAKKFESTWSEFDVEYQTTSSRNQDQISYVAQFIQSQLNAVAGHLKNAEIIGLL